MSPVPRFRAIACIAGVFAALLVSFIARPAAAFIGACHHAVAKEAFVAAQWPLGAVSPPLTREQQPLTNEVAIDAPADATFWTLSALVGNHYPDGGPFNPNDLISLAEYAARPEMQRAHCLRRVEDDGPGGDRAALAACKSYILDELKIALGDGDVPDLAATEIVSLHLLFRGDADVPLSRFAFHLGQASHALQDSFTHTFRSPDKQRVRTVLNWVDWLKGDDGYVPARDGHRHLIALDRCGTADTAGPERRAAALRATRELIAAVADDQGGRVGRLTRAATVVDSWFGIGEECTAENHWCDAPEQNYKPSLSCAVSATDGGTERTLPVALLAVAFALRRRRSRRSSFLCARSFLYPRTMAVLAVASTIGNVAFAGEGRDRCADGRSTETGAPDDADRGELKGDLVDKATPEEQRLLQSRRLGVLAGGGISIDKGGWDVTAGIRYDLGPRFTVGLGVEYNGWLSYETGRTARGSTQAFGVGVFRLDVRDYLEVRLTVAAGISVLMFDTWAARKGSFGPYFAISPLGLAIRMSSRLRLLIDPAELVIPIPQVTGIPLAYRQHRFSLGVQANF